MIRLPRWLVLTVALLLTLAVAAAVVWRDDILEALLDPKIPYAVYRPPPAPDYRRGGAWAMIGGERRDPRAVPVFFISPTTFDGGRDWNGPVSDRGALKTLRQVMLPNYAGPFARTGPVDAPLYRQASLYTSLSLFDDALEARAFAYRDIDASFSIFLERLGPGRPFIIAGVEQGGALAARLITDRVAPDPDLRGRLAAAYLIDTVVPDDRFTGGGLPACDSADQTGCVLGWMTVDKMDFLKADRLLRRARVWNDNGRLVDLAGRLPLCVNPLLGRRDNAPAPARLNKGAANATGLEWGVRPGFMARQVSAQCVGGLLRVNLPRSESLRRSGSWADRLKAPPYNLFWADIEADAQHRAALWLAAHPASAPPPSGLQSNRSRRS